MDGDTSEEVESEVETDFQDPLLVPEMNYPPSDLGNDPSYHDDALRLIRVNVRPCLDDVRERCEILRRYTERKPFNFCAII